MKRLACLVLLTIIASLFGCGSAKSPFDKGVKIEQSITVSKDHTVGDIAKTGWAIVVPQNTFDETVSLTMNVIPRYRPRKRHCIFQSSSL